MASLTFEGETHGEIVQKVRRWLASLEGEEAGHLSPVEAIQQGSDIAKEAIRFIASAAPEPIAQNEVVKSLTSAGYKVTESVRRGLTDSIDSMGELTGGDLMKTARDARRSVVYEMNSRVAKEILKAMRPR